MLKKRHRSTYKKLKITVINPWELRIPVISLGNATPSYRMVGKGNTQLTLWYHRGGQDAVQCVLQIPCPGISKF